MIAQNCNIDLLLQYYNAVYKFYYCYFHQQVGSAKTWRERTARTFLKKSSSYTLVEVLSPRNDIGNVIAGKGRKRKARDVPDSKIDRETDPVAILEFRSDEHQDPATIVSFLQTTFCSMSYFCRRSAL